MAIQKNTVHSVGNINSKDIRTIPEVFAGEDLENYSMVELGYANGVRTATYISDESKTGFLLCAVEVIYDNELFTEFYVGEGEAGRVIHFDTGVRFETSNYKAIDGTEPAKGQFAQWDTENKVFQLTASKPSEPVGGKVFEVVDTSSGSFEFGVPMVRLEVL